MLPFDHVTKRDTGKGVRHVRFCVRWELSLTLDGGKLRCVPGLPGGALPSRKSDLAFSFFLMLYSFSFSCFISVIGCTSFSFPSFLKLAYLCAFPIYVFFLSCPIEFFLVLPELAGKNSQALIFWIQNLHVAKALDELFELSIALPVADLEWHKESDRNGILRSCSTGT